MAFQHCLEVSLLVLQVDQVDEFLNSVSSFFVAADFDEVLCYALQYEHALITRAVYQQPLAEVVSIVVNHK